MDRAHTLHSDHGDRGDHGDQKTEVGSLHDDDALHGDGASDSDALSSSPSSSDMPDHGPPDLDHTAVETTTAGHEMDVELGRVHDAQSLARIASRGTVRYKLSRLSTRERPPSEGPTRPTFGEAVPLMHLAAGIVGWEGPDDPELPQNRPSRQRWLHVNMLAATTFLTTFASSILSPAIATVDSEFDNTNATLGSMTVSVYLLGYVIGPLFMAPLSEIYGRKPVLTAAGIFFCAWQLAAALAPGLPALIVFRFFAGVGGAACMTLGGSVVGDLFAPHERGLAMGVWNLGPLVGPTVGPLTGGFLVETIGWRWDFWIVLIAGAVFSAALVAVGPESNPRVLLAHKVARLSRELGRDDLKNGYYVGGSAVPATKARILLNGLVRPTKMLFLSPMILSVSVYMAFVYGVMYLLFTTIPTVFEETYGFNVGLTGLVYLSLGTSNIIGWLVVTLFSDRSVVRLAQANGGRFEPEMRMAISIFFGTCLPATFFWYGWTAQYKVQWMSPILALMPFGFGMMGLFLPATTYLVDSYPMYAASALAANVVLRSLVGALLPLAGPSLYGNLGYGWGNSVLGFISIGMIPVPLLIYKYGARMRKAQTFTL